jgi:glycosyltransferase involved in cell wall biosynthesis
MAAVQEALAEHVDLTVVFCAQAGTRGAAWEFADGLPFDHAIVGGLTLRRRWTHATDYYLSPRILTTLLRLRPDVVVAAGWSLPTAYAAVYTRLRRAGLVIHSDGTSFSERQLDLLQRISRKVLVAARPMCVANSRLAAERFAELGVPAERLFMAPHSTKLTDLWRVAEQRSAGKAGRLRVLCVGRLIPRKGVDLLVRAVHRAAEREPGISLTLVGSGPEEDALRALAASLDVGVEFRGFVDQPGLAAEYADADVFAFPTRDDPFGLVVLEAAAAGMPVLASPFGGATPELVVDGTNGYVLDPTDIDAWADALVRMAREPDLRAQMGAAAHELTLLRTPDAAARGYVAAGEAALGALA